jgi:hypothetical protein
MKLTCPACGATASADTWNNDAIARQALAVITDMPTDIARRCLTYLAMFRAPGGRGLSWQKALRLAAELKALVDGPHIQWEGKPARPNSARAWADAMERMIQQPPRRLPLKNHNYLRAIAWEIGDDIDKHAEQHRRQQENTGNFRRPSGPVGEPERLDPEWMKKVRENSMRKKRI